MVSPEYLAGFMDGEGHLSLGKIPRVGRSTEYPVRAVVYNTNREILADIRRVWGGTLSASFHRNPRWKAQVALIWTNAEAAGVLTKVAPFLRVKSQQAGALLRFHRHIRRAERARDAAGRLIPLSRREQRFRGTFHAYIKSMNARGPSMRINALRAGLRRPAEESREPPSLEYLAGFFDAEGSLMIIKLEGSGSRKSRYGARMALGNTDRDVLEDIQRGYGGLLFGYPSRKVEWKPAHYLIWTGQRVDRLLSLVGSHLRLKPPQARILMEFLRRERTATGGRGGRSLGPGTDREAALCESLWASIRALNARGSSTAARETAEVTSRDIGNPGDSSPLTPART
jgi:hypothetical protein